MRRALTLFLLFVYSALGAQMHIIGATTSQKRTGVTPWVIVDNATKGTQGYQHNYFGTWTDGPPGGVLGWNAGTLSYSNTTHDFDEVRFNGTRVEVYTETKTTHGIIAISIDGGAETNIDLAVRYVGGIKYDPPGGATEELSSTPELQVLVWRSPTLTQAVHTIKIRVTGTKNAGSSGYFGIIDHVIVYNYQDVPETPSPEPYDRFVAVGGTDDSNCSNSNDPCGSLRYTLTQSISGDKVKMGSGIFTETGGYIVVPTGVSIWGNGRDNTTVKLHSSLNWTSTFDANKAMFQYGGGGTGNQTLKDLSIEGNAKQVNAGIYVNRNNVDFDNIKISNFDRFGFHAKGTGIDLTNAEIVNSAYSQGPLPGGFSTGAILIAATTNFICDNVDINEGEGYGVKAWESQPIIQGFQFINGSVSVPPGSACCSNVNIAFELHDCYPRGCLFKNNYIDGNLSLVKPQNFADDGQFTITIDNNVFDLRTRANTNTTCIELTLHNVEVKNNYFRSAKHGFITNFDNVNPSRNWLIHHNVFYAENLVQTNPTGGIRSNSGFYNMDVWNNTFHIPPGSNQTFAVLFQGAGGSGKTSTDVQFKNNIVYDQSTADGASGANHLVRIEGTGGSYTGGSTISYNIINGMPTGSQAGITYSNNLTGAPGLVGSGVNATPLIYDPFYRPAGGSIAIESGTNVGLPFTGAAPTRGAFEVD